MPPERSAFEISHYELANPTKSFLSELGFVFENMRVYEADVIALLAKEAAGYPPVFALDFEVLHGYLFPKLQSPKSRIIPSLASYVIQNSPFPFVLPPGTIVELLSFADMYFPVIEQLKSIRKRTKYGVISKEEIDHLIESYHRLVGPGTQSNVSITEPELFIEESASYFAELSSGFERLSRLISEGRIVGLTRFFPGWDAQFEKHKDLVPAIAARISATRNPRTTHSAIVNERDAQNITTLVGIYNSLTGTPGEYQPRLLTETRPIWRLSLSDYGKDAVLERLDP